MIDPLFNFVTLNDVGKNKAHDIAVRFTTLLDELETICPKGRELSNCPNQAGRGCYVCKEVSCPL